VLDCVLLGGDLRLTEASSVAALTDGTCLTWVLTGLSRGLTVAGGFARWQVGTGLTIGLLG